MTFFRRLYVLTVIAFSLTNYPGAGRFGSLARYGSLILLAVAVFVAVGADFRSRGTRLVLPAFALFLFDCLVTGFWSQNFWLSILKLSVFALTAVGLFLGGVRFNQGISFETRNPFAPLGWVFVPAVLTSVPALVLGGGFAEGNFRGITSNSNTLGAMIALTSPWLFFELQKGIGRGKRRWGLLSLSALALVCLLLSYSRTSIGAAALVSLFALQGMRLSRRLLILYSVVSVLVLLLAFNESAYQFMYEKFVLKRSEDVMESRREQMDTSLEAAKKGGVLGLGFGVSVGQARYWSFGYFSKAAREKGSSQLAILEETGIVGFAFYLFFLGCVLRFLMKARRNPENRLLASLSLGFFLAAIMHSAFEAWFLGTGPETAFFWAGLGLCVGALERSEEIVVSPVHFQAVSPQVSR